ncbi:NAD(P)H-dependent flavin oxidoreductase [Pontibacillus salicampi]|uniref:Probable nitronate monooxygenase n=1 Tax=Pontibacillus salicampi TaxID=1449801 RepID=A0ABV6LK61_9BACI
MWANNHVKQMLRTDFPIIQAGMAGGVTSPELVAAVSNAGALGTIGAGYLSSAQLEKYINQTKSLTDKPFGVNIFIPSNPKVSEAERNTANRALAHYLEAYDITLPECDSNPSAALFDEQMNILLHYEVPVVSFTFGIPPAPAVAALKQRNITVVGTATTVREAQLNQDAGVDVIVAQGSEAGGHRGTFTSDDSHACIGTMSLVPQMVDAVHVPIIAAGGIMDGRGVLAALALGAEGVQMGTAFVTCAESGANVWHKSAILSANEDQVLLTSSITGKTARGIENQLMRDLQPFENDLPAYPIQHTLTKEIRKRAAEENNPEWMSLWSGQSPRLSTILPAHTIIEKIVQDVEKRIFQFKS